MDEYNSVEGPNWHMSGINNIPCIAELNKVEYDHLPVRHIPFYMRLLPNVVRSVNCPLYSTAQKGVPWQHAMEPLLRFALNRFARIERNGSDQGSGGYVVDKAFTGLPPGAQCSPRCRHLCNVPEGLHMSTPRESSRASLPARKRIAHPPKAGQR